MTKNIERAWVGIALLLTGIIGCSDSIDPGETHFVPGIGSSYTVVELTHDDDPATFDRLDTLLFTVAAQIGSYQGMPNVTQFNGPRNSSLYFIYHESGDLSRYYQGTSFPADAYLLPPFWAVFPYSNAGGKDVLLIDTVDGGRHVTYRLTTERKGSEEVEIHGTKFIGWRLDYTFTFEIPDEHITTTIGGRTLYVPSIGWSAWTEEITERRDHGEVTSTKRKRSELVEYVIVRDA
ncbi:MAG: hypothetical protein AB7H80_08955 [Candidatus Kapaibacterium sp.]